MTSKLKKAVEELLKEDPRCRTDDKWLIIQTLKKLGFNFWIDYRDLKNIPAFESITRCKRIIQHQENKYNDFIPEPGVVYEKQEKRKPKVFSEEGYRNYPHHLENQERGK